MAFPVFITDGERNIEFVSGSIPVVIGNVTLTEAGEIPVSANLDGVTVNATFPETVNATITNNLTVNDVIETVNVSVVNNQNIGPALDSGVYDAFGRTRVSEPVTLFQSNWVEA
jgi:hypothetical protein